MASSSAPTNWTNQSIIGTNWNKQSVLASPWAPQDWVLHIYHLLLNDGKSFLLLNDGVSKLLIQ